MPSRGAPPGKALRMRLASRQASGPAGSGHGAAAPDDGVIHCSGGGGDVAREPRRLGSMRLVRAGLWAPLWLIVACGDDPPTSRQEFASRYADLICPRLSPCCEATGKQNDVGACKRFIGLLSGTSNTTFNQAAADACLAALADWSCTEEEPAVCDAVLSGTVAVGGNCDSTSDCAAPVQGGVTCHVDYSSGRSAKGVCKLQPVPAAGQPCGPDSSTATEYFVCDEDPAFYCDSGTCTARSAIGQECAGYTGCAPGAYCDTNVSPWTCTALAKVGESCGGVGCVEGAYCDSGSCAKKKPMGEPCQGYDECEGSCDTQSGKCQPALTICFDG